MVRRSWPAASSCLGSWHSCHNVTTGLRTGARGSWSPSPQVSPHPLHTFTALGETRGVRVSMSEARGTLEDRKGNQGEGPHKRGPEMDLPAPRTPWCGDRQGSSFGWSGRLIRASPGASVSFLGQVAGCLFEVGWTSEFELRIRDSWSDSLGGQWSGFWAPGWDVGSPGQPGGSRVSRGFRGPPDK